MKVLFFSSKTYEQPYLEKAAGEQCGIAYCSEALTLQSAGKAAGFDAISIFTGDDAGAPVLEQLHALGVKYIAIRAAGYDNVDLVKATELGIAVANVPQYSPYAIAEHAVALLQALNRKIILADKQVHAHDFTTQQLIGFDLNGKTVGIIGVGKIGGVFAKIMHGFGCRLLGFDKWQNSSLTADYGLTYVDFETLCRESDVISIHTGLTPETQYLVNTTSLSNMKRGVIIVNTGRGGCVNTADMIEAIESGQVAAYGADAYEKERPLFFYDYSGKDINDPLLEKLLSLPQVLLTPHQAFATREALTNIADATLQNILCWKNNRPALHALC